MSPLDGVDATPARPDTADRRTDLEQLKEGAALLAQHGNRVAALAVLWAAVAIDPVACSRSVEGSVRPRLDRIGRGTAQTISGGRIVPIEAPPPVAQKDETEQQPETEQVLKMSRQHGWRRDTELRKNQTARDGQTGGNERAAEAGGARPPRRQSQK